VSGAEELGKGWREIPAEVFELETEAKKREAVRIARCKMSKKFVNLWPPHGILLLFFLKFFK